MKWELIKMSEVPPFPFATRKNKMRDRKLLEMQTRITDMEQSITHKTEKDEPIDI